ncbi:hypothetical protein V2A60_007088 [Cordyceps javanica]|uniref:Uncharacterized protein n=1 Tax=Cordyceps javanica TaxID=43265 RepID=A0A545VRK0_9HYPO|nr:hypothetical protein IF1G_08914 [Cordyceps javanica]TQW04360.1 hypothetical protein IF2G_08130 [Cordyceps javanica]
MAIRDRVRRALRKSEASDTISQTESNTTTTTTTTTSNTSQSSHDGPQLEKTSSRLARVLTFGSSSQDSKEREKERAEKRDRKAAAQSSRRRTHPRDRPLTTQNIRHQEMLSHFSMTFGASDPAQIETMSFVGVSPCCTRRGSLDLDDPLSRGSTTSFSNASSATDSSRDE